MKYGEQRWRGRRQQHVAVSVVCLALAIGSAACGGDTPSSASRGGGGGSGLAGQGSSAGASGTASAGASGTASAGHGAGGGGSAGTLGTAGGHDASAGAGSGTGAEIDLSGTWISQVKTAATESAPPIVGPTAANLQLVFRIVFSKVDGMLHATYAICDLTSVTTPDPKALIVTFTPAVIATLTTKFTESVGALHVGDSVPFPKLTILSGVDAAGQTVDSDSDSNPGVTIPASIGGLLSAKGYAGLTVEASLTSKLTGPDTLDGTVSVSANGVIVGSDNPTLLKSGTTISVVPKTSEIPFSAARLAGDVPCSEVLKHFP